MLSAALYLLFICVSLQFRGTSSRFSFQDQSYTALLDESYLLNRTSYARIGTAYELYELPPVRKGEFSCSPFIIEVTDFASLPNDHLRPQVLISGEIHGDERVGPIASLGLAQLLVYSAECILKQSKKYCQMLDKWEGISNHDREILAMLVTKRDIFIMPAANCMGHYYKSRADINGIDPNRDFPYSRHDNRCFQSLTAQFIREVMTDNIIQIVVTYHAGMVAIAYEWGALHHPAPKDISPADNAHREIAMKMKEFSGSFTNEPTYPG